MSFDTPSNNINLLKALEITLRDGVDPVSGKQIGVPDGPIRGLQELLTSFSKPGRSR